MTPSVMAPTLATPLVRGAVDPRPQTHFRIFLALKMRLVLTILAAFVRTKMSAFGSFLGVFENFLYCTPT